MDWTELKENNDYNVITGHDDINIYQYLAISTKKFLNLIVNLNFNRSLWSLQVLLSLTIGTE